MGLDINLSAEAYYKSMKNIVEYRDGADFISAPTIETELLQGRQQAYGIELMIKKPLGRLNGWDDTTGYNNGGLRWGR